MAGLEALPRWPSLLQYEMTMQPVVTLTGLNLEPLPLRHAGSHSVYRIPYTVYRVQLEVTLSRARLREIEEDSTALVR